ncbi:hypothetical protein JCM31598_03000 [Desulfonatronum parangueonense]
MGLLQTVNDLSLAVGLKKKQLNFIRRLAHEHFQKIREIPHALGSIDMRLTLPEMTKIRSVQNEDSASHDSSFPKEARSRS